MAGDRLLRQVELEGHRSLAEYEAVAHLAQAVHELRSEAGAVLSRLASRTVWMVNSAAQGGGVAEMLVSMVPILQDLGVRTEWVAIGSREPVFFTLTKRIHNLIHGTGDPRLGGVPPPSRRPAGGTRSPAASSRRTAAHQGSDRHHLALSYWARYGERGHPRPGNS